MSAETLIIKGVISEESEEAQALIKATYKLLKDAVEAAEAQHPGAGVIAWALLGAEKSERTTRQSSRKSRPMG